MFLTLIPIIFNVTVTLVVFLLILSFLVIIHELGHFLTARWAKIDIEEFGIGYPPRMKTLFHWKGIPFTLNWLPLGGFVKMKGEDGPSVEDVTAAKTKTAKKNSNPSKEFGPFYTKSKRVRLLVLLAGVVINFLFGIFAFAVIYTKLGIPVPSDAPVINVISPQSPASQAKLREGDKVYRLESVTDGQSQVEPKTVDELVVFVNGNLGENLRLHIDRQGNQFTTDLYARKPEERGPEEGALGLRFQGYAYQFYPWWQMPFRGAWVGINISLGFSSAVLSAFFSIIKEIVTFSSIPAEASGPIGIVRDASNLGIFQQGWLELLRFAGMLSINLAVLNALPIPALDGGRAFFVIFETVIGKKRREQIEEKFNYAGFVFLMGLILLISLKDVWLVLRDMFTFFTK